jgi:protein subunit release factor B
VNPVLSAGLRPPLCPEREAGRRKLAAAADASVRTGSHFLVGGSGGLYSEVMSTFPVSPEKEDLLAQRLATLGVREADLEESFVRSSGPGGQNVNKTATCVVLRHRPTGLQVRCQETRQQGFNRFLARHLLLDKMEAHRRSQVEAERARIEKIRRQRRRRSRGAKERMLADKAHQAKKKANRRGAALD